MDNLRVVENKGLIKVYETDIGEKVVNARELHAGLGNKRRFADWVKQRINEVDALENEDYILISQNCETSTGGTVRKEYILKLDIAKEMAMLERNDKGKQYRRYFIELEKKYKAQNELPANKQTLAIARLMNAKTRQANLLYKIAERTSIKEHRQVLYARATQLISGKLLIPLPIAERPTYTAGEIGLRLGITANMVGRLTNKHDLKTAEYGKLFYDKSRYSNKEVESFRYYENVVDRLKEVM